MIERLDGCAEEMCSPDTIKTDTITYFLNPDDVETFDGAYRKVGTIKSLGLFNKIDILQSIVL